MKEALINHKPNTPDFCCELKAKYSQQLKLNQSFRRYRELEQDILAQSLIPSDVPVNVIARKAIGDGNCLFHAISLSLVGTTKYSIILRILTVIELFENAAYYASHPRFREAQQSGCPFGEVTIAEWERSRSRVSAVKSDAIGGCQLGQWSSLIHIMALATVICRPIFTIYPNCAVGIRPLLHGLVKPRGKAETVSDKECFYILWSREGGLDNRPNAIYVPNHFVPLFQENAEEETCQKDEPIRKAPPLKRSFCLEDFWFPSAEKKKRKQTCTKRKSMKVEDDRTKKMKEEMAMENGKKMEGELEFAQDGLKVKEEMKMEDERKVEDEAVIEEGREMKNKKKMDEELELPQDGLKTKDEKRMEDEKKIEDEAVIEEEREMKNEMRLAYER